MKQTSALARSHRPCYQPITRDITRTITKNSAAPSPARNMVSDMTNLEQALSLRAEARCELCGDTSELAAWPVSNAPITGVDAHILACHTCRKELEDADAISDANRWFCLQESIWSQYPAVQVTSWRQLQALATSHAWAKDLLEQAYLDEETLAWASAGLDDGQDDAPSTVDCFGNPLQRGDTVVLTKALNVKGTSFTARHGTVVKNIRLTQDPEYIEGKVNGTIVMLKTCFLKKG